MTKSIHTPEMSCLNRWLRERRKSRGLTMRELGERLGVAHSYVQKVESGERRLDVVEYIWYCRALDAEPGEGLGVVLKCAENMPEWARSERRLAGDAAGGSSSRHFYGERGRLHPSRSGGGPASVAAVDGSHAV